MTGSEKQVAWASEIKSRYEARVADMERIIELYKDMTQTEEIIKDPIFKKTTIRKVYAVKATYADEAIIDSIRAWAPKDSNGGNFWAIERADELTGEHKDREAMIEYLTITRDALKKALAEQDDARYWIDRR